MCTITPNPLHVDNELKMDLMLIQEEEYNWENSWRWSDRAFTISNDTVKSWFSRKMRTATCDYVMNYNITTTDFKVWEETDKIFQDPQHGIRFHKEELWQRTFRINMDTDWKVRIDYAYIFVRVTVMSRAQLAHLEAIKWMTLLEAPFFKEPIKPFLFNTTNWQ